MHKMCLLNKYEKLIWKHMKSGMITGNPEQIGNFLGAFNLNYEAYSNVHEVTLANLEGKNYI